MQTFQGVLSDMRTQNQFFNPDSPNKNKSISESMILPCLPYLLDEFILANLHDMAVQLTKHAAGGQRQIAPTETMTVETMTVASSFHSVIKEMMAKCKTEGHEDDEEESAISKMAVLTVLDRAIERVLEDANDIPDQDFNVNEEMSEADPIKISPDDKKDDGGETSRTSSQVKSDMAKLRNSIGEVSEAARRYSENLKLEEDTNLVLSATRQVIASLQEDRMSDDELDSFVQTFLPDEQGLNTREQKRDKLEARLSSLVTSITANIVPASRLNGIGRGDCRPGQPRHRASPGYCTSTEESQQCQRGFQSRIPQDGGGGSLERVQLGRFVDARWAERGHCDGKARVR